MVVFFKTSNENIKKITYLFVTPKLLSASIITKIVCRFLKFIVLIKKIFFKNA